MVEPPQTHWNLHCRPASPFITEVWHVVEPHSKLPCMSAYPVVEGGSVLLNHPKLTRNCPVGQIPPASQWFEEVQCTPNTLEPTL